MQSNQSKIVSPFLQLAAIVFIFFTNQAQAKYKLNFTDKEVINDTVVATAAAANTKTYLALGDSYTIGQSVDSTDRFPVQTAAIMKRRGVTISSIDYIATTGWKTVNLQWAIEDMRLKKTYDLVSLLIGANDQYLKRDTTGYREHFTNLLQKAIVFANHDSSHVFVLSIPDYGVTPFGSNLKKVSEQIDEFNAINKDVARTYGVSYTNITGISRFDAIDSSTIAWDDMHPSGKQYAQWAQALASKMLNVLE